MKEEWLAAGEERTLRAEQIAVLARNRLQLGAVLEAFKAEGVVHYFATGELGPFDSELYRAILYGLKVLANPRDLAIRKGLLAQIPMSVKSTELDNLTAINAEDMFRHLANLTVEPYRGWLELLTEKSATHSLGVMERLSSWNPTPVDAQDEMVELWRSDRELLSTRWSGYRNRIAGTDRTWAGFVLQIVDQPRADRKGIRILTIHAAKGSEFSAVALVGLNDGSLPDFRSRSNVADYASEKRIAYVAVTRAARVLRLSRPRSRQTRYGPRAQDESPFIKDMGVTLVLA
jgi:DNA helicase-2/ATP-dependent DNA helicase PcrA